MPFRESANYLGEVHTWMGKNGEVAKKCIPQVEDFIRKVCR